MSGTIMSRLRVPSLPACYSYVSPPDAVPPRVIRLCHTYGFGPSLCVTFMSLLRVQSLPACYNFVTPPGAIPPRVIQLCHTSGCRPFLCVGGENKRAGGELRHPGSPESPDLRVSRSQGV